MRTPKRLAGLWLAFTPDTPEEQAVARFTEKHGHPPQEVHRSNGLLLVGPIGGNGRKQSKAGLLRRTEAAHRPMTPTEARQLLLNLGGER